MSELRKCHSNILDLDEISLTKLLSHDHSKYENKVNDIISFINFILSTKQFEIQLMWLYF